MSVSLFSQLPFPVGPALSPFTPTIPTAAISSLKQLLNLTPIPEACYENTRPDMQWGVGRDWLTGAVTEWKDKFDWKKQEARINTFPHFKYHVVDDDKKEYDIHFTGVFSPKKDAIPILFLHGWPGSFLEFLPILTNLRDKHAKDPSSLAFHAIVPSLPGFGFTKIHADKNYVQDDAERLLNKMMIGLGFKEYLAQGGDMGAGVARGLAVKYKEVKAAHVNMLVVPQPNGTVPAPSAVELQALQRMKWFGETGMAYAMTHATKPSTVGLAIASNPVSLLAWIGEKMSIWSDKPIKLEDILTNVALYWFTGSYPTSIWVYRESVGSPADNPHTGSLKLMNKPFGASWFPKEIAASPKSWADATGKVTYFRQHDRGGHFAALEEPELLWNDVQEFALQVWGKK